MAELKDEKFKMSNQEAAAILKELLANTKLLIGRGSTKSSKALQCLIAMSKAITVLENTPDDKKLINEPDYCNGCKREHSSDPEGGTDDFYDGKF